MPFIYAATKEFITYAGDTLPDTPFLGTLEKPILFERSIITSNGFGELNIGYGELELINLDGEYDSLIGTYGIDGQRVRLRVGSVTATGAVDNYDNFGLLADLTATGWVITEDSVIVSLRDKSYKLEVHTQTNVYGDEDDIIAPDNAELADKHKPMCLGEVHNISPVLVDSGSLIYQVNNGPIQSIDAVYDAGGLLVNHGDWESTSAMKEDADIVDGYVTCLAEGTLMLGASPYGVVTADVHGHVAASPSGYLQSTAEIVRFLVLNATDLTESDIDQETFNMLDTIQPATIGYYLDAESNELVSETVGKLMTGINGWIGFDSVGRLQVQHIAPPTAVAVERYDEHDLISLARDKLPTGIDPILKNARVIYDRNWTPLEGTQVLPYVTENSAERLAFLISETRIATPSNDQEDTIRSYHPLALDPDPIEAYFLLHDDARAEADNLMAMYGVERSMYRFVVKEHMFAQNIGDTIFLQAPRLGLDNGKYLLVVQVRDDLERMETEIVGFG